MPDVIIDVFTPQGARVGKFINPKIEMVPDHNYSVTGIFVDDQGNTPDRIEFNPEILPYTLDIGAATKCTHNKVTKAYVQRARQPVNMTGVCLIK